MSIELFPTGRDPLRRLGTISLITGLMGLLAIIYTMVKYVRDRNSADDWMLGVGFCLLLAAVATSLIQGVLINFKVRIEALEKHTDCPVDKTPS